ncbi:hypothetical protein Dfri01_59760 [Dyadobacter frigoris]|uniref:hypothetical protein n=1 Tax=Dyadobacter frigoris TaxID=2576211 RepID=UPI00249FB711|nr:hypothetical protein [Dyadobacter frigoris]GLU56515.1 hypothetical protein Dfri01_59760 [Dyadobacter frigoris]
MKNAVYILIMFLGLGILTGCEGQLSLTPMEDYGATPGYPEFNFSFRAMDGKIGNDTSYIVIPTDTISKSKTVFLELYLKQLTFSKKLNYKLTYQVDEGTDASLVYGIQEIRANDWLNVTTSNFIDDKLYIRFIPITLGTTSVTITCTDDSKKSKSFKKAFFVVK